MLLVFNCSCCCHWTVCFLSAVAAAGSSKASSGLQRLEMSHFTYCSLRKLWCCLLKSKCCAVHRSVCYPENKHSALLLPQQCWGCWLSRACLCTAQSCLLCMEEGFHHGYSMHSSITLPLSYVCWRDHTKHMGFPHQALALYTCTEVSCSCILRLFSAGLSHFVLLSRGF